MARSPIKRRTNGEAFLSGLGRRVAGLFSGRMVTDTPEYERMENDLARIRGQRAYHQGSPSSAAIKRKVAIKMGAK